MPVSDNGPMLKYGFVSVYTSTEWGDAEGVISQSVTTELMRWKTRFYLPIFLSYDRAYRNIWTIKPALCYFRFFYLVAMWT